MKKRIISSTKKALHKIKHIFRGFTVIELIVVISIIATLASIILVSVTSYIGKSKDSRVKAETFEIVGEAVMHYSSFYTYAGYVPSSFPDVCPGSSYEFSTDGDNVFVAYAKLCTSDKYWCVDSTGTKIELDNPPDTGTYACVSGGVCGDALCGAGENCSNCSSDCSCSSGYSCVTDQCVQNFTCGGTLTDSRDGKTYPTVLIGDMCWLAKNLDYNNGCASKTWVNDTDVGWCGYYTGGPFANEGLLYQWSAAAASGLCPAGWHLPSHAEWHTLEYGLWDGVTGECSSIPPFNYECSPAGDKLKNAGLCQGRTPCGTSGFNGLLAGYQCSNCGSNGRGSYGYFWSSTQYSSAVAWDRTLGENAAAVYQYRDGNKAAGFSVRCLKD